MKQSLRILPLLTVLLLTMQHSSRAVTISGTIYTTGGVYGAVPTPAVGATVWIFFNFAGLNYVSTTTSSTGAYSITVPSSWASTALLDLRDSASSGGCHGSQQRNYYGSNMVINDTMCNYQWFTMSGKVTLQGGAPAANAKVWFINEEADTTGGVTKNILKAYDSTVTNATGDYIFAHTWYIITNSQRVKAALQTGSSSYANFLPTYHDSSLVWSGATTFGSSVWASNATNVNIMLLGGANPGGPGFIAGDVLLGANKTAGVGDPLSSRILLLTTAAGKGIAYTYSDTKGHFSFSNLPTGAYKLFGDAWGKTNPPLAINITGTAPTVMGVIFEENSSAFKGRLNALSINSGNALEVISVYPSPMDAYFEISALQAASGPKTAVLRNITGAVISRTDIGAGANNARVATEKLSAGIYLLELQTEAGSRNFKLVKQ